MKLRDKESCYSCREAEKSRASSNSRRQGPAKWREGLSAESTKLTGVSFLCLDGYHIRNSTAHNSSGGGCEDQGRPSALCKSTRASGVKEDSDPRPHLMGPHDEVSKEL